MKKTLLYSFLPLLVAMMMGATFTACGDDEDDPTENVQTEQSTATDGDTTDSTGSGDGSSEGITDGTEENKGEGDNDEDINYGGTTVTDSRAIDLGLSVKWASCNVGASSPEEYGGYYAWGETEEKADYDWDTYKWCNGSYNTLTKYCTSSSYGTVDGKTILDPADDVAHVKWGGTWRMPTRAEQDELRNKCSWTWTTLNGVTGYRVTGPNGNSIFLPAAGYRYGTRAYSRGSYGGYWSSSLYSSYSIYAYNLYFNSSSKDWNISYRCDGHTVRPVSE